VIARLLPTPALFRMASILAATVVAATFARADDRIKALQTAAVANANVKMPRPYHFGSQGPGDVFSNHASHTNRLIPVYVFGRKARLDAVTGANSVYRDADKLRALYGFLPEHTVNPTADYADQSDLYRVQKDAVAHGVKHLFILWFDGLDWPTTQAAAIARTGKVYTEGKGAGLFFQDYSAGGSATYGYFVTNSTHDRNRPDVNDQAVQIDAGGLEGGYDARIAGPNPWQLGPLGLRAPGYIKGQGATAADRDGVKQVGGVLHAYPDSAPTAAEFATGVKSYNNGINVAEDGRMVPTLFQTLQGQGWKVGTVTSVPFNHASPAAMYAHNVYRDDYQDLARDMLGLRGIGQSTGRDRRHPGLDVVIGTGFGQEASANSLKAQGKNGVAGNVYLTDADREAIDARNGGDYVVAHTERGIRGAAALADAAAIAASRGKRLFGFYGSKAFNHLPYRTADGRYDPAPNLGGGMENYTQADLDEQPTLTDMTRAALTVLESTPDRPFALFVEAGDVDFGLHSNNLDTTLGAIYSGEEAMHAIVDWVEKHSNWDDSLLIVTADHGHYLVVDEPEALIPR
jgi:alkaline phosphatase